MKASELRIGNHIQCLDDILTVEYLDKLLVKGNYHRDAVWNTSVQLKHCKPIPLTEEWFLKLGFKKEKSDIPTFSKVFGSFIEDDYEHCLIINLDADDNLYTIVNGVKLILKYVHQMQNLYHALTLEELCK